MILNVKGNQMKDGDPMNFVVERLSINDKDNFLIGEN